MTFIPESIQKRNFTTPVSKEVLNRHIGISLRELRKEHQLDQTQLAKMLGITRTSVSNIEGGRQSLTIETMAALSQWFGLEFPLFPPINKIRWEVQPLYEEQTVTIKKRIKNREIFIKP